MAIETKKTEIVNPRTGRRMNIDKNTYDVISKAIYHELKKKKALTWTELADGVKECLRTKKIAFEGSVEWYAVSVRNDMESKGLIRKYKENGRLLNALSN
jgi:hypothetical protein